MARHRIPGVTPQVQGRAIVRHLANHSPSPFALAAIAATGMHLTNLAGNPHLPDALWDALWERGGEYDDIHRDALARRPLPRDRQDRVASRVHDYSTLVAFVSANPDLTAEQITRLRPDGRRRGESLAARQARLLADAADRSYVAPAVDVAAVLTARELAEERDTLIVSEYHSFPEDDSAIALTMLLDPHGQAPWDVAITLLWDSYPGTLGELADTAIAV